MIMRLVFILLLTRAGIEHFSTRSIDCHAFPLQVPLSFHSTRPTTAASRLLPLSCSTSNQEENETSEEEGEKDGLRIRERLQNGESGFQRITKTAGNRLLPRRDLLITATVAAVSSSVFPSMASASVQAGGGFRPAVRPTAYRVDSTIPPTLLPVPTAREQLTVLRDLGRGLGTNKEAVFIDRLNLNNILQKAVYGTANVISSIGKSSANTQASASFVCLGLPGGAQPKAADVELGVSLMQTILTQAQKSGRQTAIGVAIFPLTMQAALDDLVAGRITITQLQDVWQQQRQSQQTPASASLSSSSSYSPSSSTADQDLVWQAYLPLLQFAVTNKIHLIAMNVAESDRTAVKQQGLQNVNARDKQYVVDADGFIATNSNPKFKLYADRSLLKDYHPEDGTPTKTTATAGNFYAERILVHEAGATAVAQYAFQMQPTPCVVIVVAPTADLRYLGGINGRIPRVYQYLASSSSATTTTNTTTTEPAAVTDKDVTTILLNPVPAETLSTTVRLRLEIGTGPDTLAYQTKIADYLWFSSSPRVSLLPRMMDY